MLTAHSFITNQAPSSAEHLNLKNVTKEFGDAFMGSLMIQNIFFNYVRIINYVTVAFPMRDMLTLYEHSYPRSNMLNLKASLRMIIVMWDF